jgi:hypothetical protein
MYRGDYQISLQWINYRSTLGREKEFSSYGEVHWINY